MHHTVSKVLKTVLHTNPPQNIAFARDMIDNALATAMHAMLTMVAATLGSTTEALAFAQCMFLNVQLITELQAILCFCEQHVNENLCCLIRSCISIITLRGKRL